MLPFLLVTAYPVGTPWVWRNGFVESCVMLLGCSAGTTTPFTTSTDTVYLLQRACLCWLRAATCDPGYIPRAGEHAPAWWALEGVQHNGGQQRMGLGVCTTCRVDRPLRSKHCTMCNRCASQCVCELVSTLDQCYPFK